MVLAIAHCTLVVAIAQQCSYYSEIRSVENGDTKDCLSMAYYRDNRHQNESRKHIQSRGRVGVVADLDRSSPHFSDAEMARFALRGRSLLLWGGWEFIVPIYFAQDCPRTSLVLQEAIYLLCRSYYVSDVFIDSYVLLISS